jgi:hypothetical protein
MRPTITKAALAEVQQLFEKDTANHIYIVEHDDGMMRCIFARAQNSAAYWFRVVTWAEVLAISGDMGTFVFRRWGKADGMSLFRGNAAVTGDIQYIASKLIASSDPVHKFNLERTIANLLDALKDVFEGKEDEFKEHFDSISDTDENGFIDAVASFEIENDLPIPCDWPESCVHSFTEHFVWCVLAIIKTIQEYDKTKQGGKADD